LFGGVPRPWKIENEKAFLSRILENPQINVEARTASKPGLENMPGHPGGGGKTNVQGSGKPGPKIGRPEALNF